MLNLAQLSIPIYVEQMKNNLLLYYIPAMLILVAARNHYINIREFDSWISEKSTCRSHKTCFFCVKFLVFIYCILLQCVVKYNKGGILHASYYIEI